VVIYSAMGRTSVKSIDPIPLPHDGLLHSYLHTNGSEATNNNNDDPASDIVSRALNFLSEGDSVAAINAEENSSQDTSPTGALIFTLKTAKQIKEQLHALQAYRSTILHQRRNQNNKSSPRQEQENDNIEKAVLYRILLEWFLSYQTPLPLRRAIQSSLDALAEDLEMEEQQQYNNSLPSEIRDKVLGSIYDNHQQQLSSSSLWSYPLHSLHEAMNYKATHDALVLKEDCAISVLQFLRHYWTQEFQSPLEKVEVSSVSSSSVSSLSEQQDEGSVFFVEQEVTDAVQRAVQWAGIVKIILSDAPFLAIRPSHTSTGSSPSLITNNQQLFVSIQNCLWSILTCRITAVDALSNLGIACSRVLLQLHPPTSTKEGNNIPTLITNFVAEALPPLTTIAIVQGMAATVPIGIMLQESDSFMAFFQLQSNEADPGVRLAALKGIHTLVSRCLTRISTTAADNTTEALEDYEQKAIQSMTQGTLKIVLQAWENPPNRRLGNAIPSLFQKLVALMQETGANDSMSDSEMKHSNNGSTEHKSFEDLVLQLLAQPSNRKGRYKALETLLPIVGSRQIILLGGWKLMESLLEGIGDRNSHNAGTIADLWAKILSDLLEEIRKENASTSNGPQSDDGNNNEKKSKKARKDFSPEQIHQVLPTWLDNWVPSLASALLSNMPTRRKQVAAFCLPRIVPMVGGRKRQIAANLAFASVLKAVDDCALSGNGFGSAGQIIRLGDINDRALWATLEVRHLLQQRSMEG
jgi:hypothetical protein